MDKTLNSLMKNGRGPDVLSTRSQSMRMSMQTEYILTMVNGFHWIIFLAGILTAAC